MILVSIQKIEFNSDERVLYPKSEKPVRDLSEKDILAAMKRLGIQKLELTEENTRVVSQSTMKGARYCIYCGNKQSPAAAYCERCGKKIAS